MRNFIIHILSYWRYLQIIRFGFHTPCMDIWNDKGHLVPVDDIEYRSLIRSYLQTSLFAYYLQQSTHWKHFSKAESIPDPSAHGESQQLEFDF